MKDTLIPDRRFSSCCDLILVVLVFGGGSVSQHHPRTKKFENRRLDDLTITGRTAGFGRSGWVSAVNKGECGHYAGNKRDVESAIIYDAPGIGEGATTDAGSLMNDLEQ